MRLGSDIIRALGVVMVWLWAEERVAMVKDFLAVKGSNVRSTLSFAIQFGHADAINPFGEFLNDLPAN